MSESLSAILGAHRLIWEGAASSWHCTCGSYVDTTLWPGFKGADWDEHLEAAVQEKFALIPHSRLTLQSLVEVLLDFKEHSATDGWNFRTRDAARALIPYLLTGEHDV